MSSYISLNPHTQLEQAITYDLQSALEKRGLSVIHNGTSDSHTPGGKPDIIVFNKDYMLIIEVTRSKGSAQDREFQSIRSHLKEVKAENMQKQCFCVFVSPKTSSRTMDSIHDHNRQRASEGKADMKILPLVFNTFELWITRLKESTERKYSVKDFMSTFEQHEKFTSDLDIQKIFSQAIFVHDKKISEVTKQKTKKNLELPFDDSEHAQNKLKISRSEVGLDVWMEHFIHYSTRGWNRFAKTTGISLTQFNIMTQLYEREVWSISEISEYFEITVPAASQLVDKLVQSGLVHRVENQTDRRARYLTLSSNGVSLVDKGIRERHRWVDEFFKYLSAADQKKVSEALILLTHAAKEMEQKK